MTFQLSKYYLMYIMRISIYFVLWKLGLKCESHYLKVFMVLKRAAFDQDISQFCLTECNTNVRKGIRTTEKTKSKCAVLNSDIYRIYLLFKLSKTQTLEEVRRHAFNGDLWLCWTSTWHSAVQPKHLRCQSFLLLIQEWCGTGTRSSL